MARDCASLAARSPVVYARHAFTLSTLRLASGVTIVKAEPADHCLCGAGPNCWTVALAAEGSGAYRRVFEDGVYSADFGIDGSLVTKSREDAAIYDRTSYLFDGATYRLVREERTDEENGVVKLAWVPLHFAAGTSSATVTGTVYGLNFGDTYSVVAAAGQTLSIRAHATSGTLSGVAVATGEGADRRLLTTSDGLVWQGKLPKSGRYDVSIAGAGYSRPATYSMTIGIR